MEWFNNYTVAISIKFYQANDGKFAPGGCWQALSPVTGLRNRLFGSFGNRHPALGPYDALKPVIGLGIVLVRVRCEPPVQWRLGVLVLRQAAGQHSTVGYFMLCQ